MLCLIACEYSNTVSGAFREAGHTVFSNDIIPSEGPPEFHLQGDCMDAVRAMAWDLIVIHIPCTAMGVCGNGTYGRGKQRHQERLDAVEWSLSVWDAAVATGAAVAMENPASVLFPVLRDKRNADVQYIQPWMFGHTEQKKTGLALHKLPRLVPTNDVYTEMLGRLRKERERILYMSPGPDRRKERARFYTGIADAMVSQWSSPGTAAPAEIKTRYCK